MNLNGYTKDAYQRAKFQYEKGKNIDVTRKI